MSFKLVISVHIALCTVVFGRNVRIIGGQPADIREFPHAVSFKLISTGLHICGGSIITNLHILTAAHCLTEYHHSLIRVYTGSSFFKITDHNDFGIVNFTTHPKYTEEHRISKMLHHDISVVLLDKSIVFNEFQNKIRLPSKNPNMNSLGLISGWGLISSSEFNYPEILQKADMRILSNLECSLVMPFIIYSDQLCALRKLGIGACYGDSGIGLINNGEIVGIASFVNPCALGEPDVYTRVYSYMQFITCALTNSEYTPSNSKCSVQ